MRLEKKLQNQLFIKTWLKEVVWRLYLRAAAAPSVTGSPLISTSWDLVLTVEMEISGRRSVSNGDILIWSVGLCCHVQALGCWSVVGPLYLPLPAPSSICPLPAFATLNAIIDKVYVTLTGCIHLDHPYPLVASPLAVITLCVVSFDNHRSEVLGNPPGAFCIC